LVRQKELKIPILLTTGASIAGFALINVLGFWDVEDLFTSGSSLGARFGLATSGSDRVNELVYSVWGVPLLDFGIIGGYRLPFQGTINTGPFWIFRNILPVEILLSLTQLTAMVLAATAFGRLWYRIHGSGPRLMHSSNLLCILCWTALQLPTFEYLLQQDWYAGSLANQGFVTVIASLFTILYDYQTDNLSTMGMMPSVRFTLAGSYLCLLGHTGTLVVYSPTILCLVLVVGYSIWRGRDALSLNWRRWKLELWFFAVVLSRLIVHTIELTPEISIRSRLVEHSWWATPTQSVSDFKHFAGQLIGTELKVWLLLVDEAMLARFNISSLSRLPHAAVFLLLTTLILAFRSRRQGGFGLEFVVFIFWIVNFLWMLKIIPNPLRAPVDYVFRDVLLALSMISVALVFRPSETYKGFRKRNQSALVLLLLVGSTSFSVSVINPIRQLQLLGAPSPFALAALDRQSNDWQTVVDSDSTDPDVLAVIDPTFLSRWQDETITNQYDRNWKGLRGFYQLRQAGLISLEGTPKIRDATAFTGRTESLVQNLDPPTSEFCNTQLFGFLGVDKIVMSTDTYDTCYSKLLGGMNSLGVSAELSRGRQLGDSGRFVADLSFASAFMLGEEVTATSGDSRCGLLTDTDCFRSLGITPSPDWMVSHERCSLPCVVRLVRRKSSNAVENSLIIPFNTANGLRAIDEGSDQIPVSQLNGLVTIPISGTARTEIELTISPDFRMWFQVFVAYFQYFVLIVAMIRTYRHVRLR
jgi:hypothetical protein